MEVRDSIYSFEIARRAVGRAAFHLGVDSMSEAALDVLADVLLNYLNRVGRTLSHLVESSGRTSSHVNLLDALQACELVASPAVERMHVMEDATEEESLFATGAATGKQHLSSDWKGLAAFLFGPHWLDEKDDDKEAPKEVQGAGGKQGPSATDSAKPKQVGWDAPYLDEVEAFPRASDACANPHPLPSHVGLSLHRKQEEDEKQVEQVKQKELDQIPDHAFDTAWGSMEKRKLESADDKQTSEDVEMTDATTPPKKKVRVDDPKMKDTDRGEAETAGNDTLGRIARAKRHVPSFYPPPPIKTKSQKEGRTIVDILPPQRVEKGDGSQMVRSSLIQLGQYWGSGWDSSDKSKSTSVVAVPCGRNEAGDQKPTTATVVPLGRASGSRVSRILEGSMDAAAMQ